MQIKITTFNLENLFNRYAFLDRAWAQRDYEKFVQAVDVVSLASRQGDLVKDEITVIQRNNTAQAILDASPDILVVQEIENIYSLRIFNDTYLDNYFDRIISIDGNDPRGIDVGLMVRAGLDVEIINIRTHFDEASTSGAVRRGSSRELGYVAENFLFSRDCLEVDIKANGKILTFLVNHFKSQDGKPASIERRTKQADRVAQIVEKLIEAGKLPIVMGDLNVDQKHPRTAGDTSLKALLSSPVLQDPFPADTWTHYYVPEKSVSRLDYILPAKNLKVTSIEIIRHGLTTKCKQYKGFRYPTIGAEHTEASDHCPTSVILDLSSD
jgi:endonuclease/exonuclease/phosphatase family metal-dependent hydrolase